MSVQGEETGKGARGQPVNASTADQRLAHCRIVGVSMGSLPHGRPPRHLSTSPNDTKPNNRPFCTCPFVALEDLTMLL